MKKYLLLPLVLIMVLPFPVHGFWFAKKSAPTDAKNILLIVVDDLRPAIGAYGARYMHTPAMDALAEKSVLFERAYSNVPVCGASRASMMTGIRPSRKRFMSFFTAAEKDAPGVVGFSGHLKEYGYETISLGKVYHHHATDNEDQWSVPPWHPRGKDGTHHNFITEENLALRKKMIKEKTKRHGLAYESPEVEDEAYYDGKIAARAVSELHRLAGSGKPFMLAVGFLKPHLPFNAPQKYWELYERSDIALSPSRDIPKNAPKVARHKWGELRKYSNIPQGSGLVPPEQEALLRHAYYACVSYIDAQIAKLVAALEETGLAGDTIIIVTSDHGFALGEHGLWAKHSPFHVANHIPLIIHTPDMRSGAKSGAPVELVDIYPTLIAMLGLPKPKHRLDGRDLTPLLENPDERWRAAVFPRWKGSDSIVSREYSYTQWMKNGKRIAEMLYHLKSDPHELDNVVQSSEHRNAKRELQDMLKKQKAELQ